jgi:small nuclear ribonucleoprotein (snRNP)-like protein
MAKFSQAFLQGLLQPSYQEGLFTAARGIGMRPQMQALQQQQQQEKMSIDQAIAMGNKGIQENDPVALARAAQMLRQAGQITESIRFAQAAAKAKEFQDKRSAEQTRAAGIVSRLQQLEQPEVAALVEDNILTPSKGADIIFGLVSKERKNKIPPEMSKKLGELAQTDENAKMVLEDITENDSRDAISRAYKFLDDYGKEDKPEKPKDYTLTKAEEKVYDTLLKGNKDEFEGILPEEKGFFFTSPIDYDKRVLFDEAERIRVNSPETISKEEALRRAFKLYGEEKAPIVEGDGWSIRKRG